MVHGLPVSGYPETGSRESSELLETRPKVLYKNNKFF